MHRAALDRALDRVERPRDLVEAEVGHVLVDLPGQLDELGVEVVLPSLPGEVERVDRQAVTAEAGAGLEAHEAERLRGGGVDDLPDVDAHAVAELRQLVDQRDVDGAEDVLEQLGQLGRLRGGHRDRRCRSRARRTRRPPSVQLSVMPPTILGVVFVVQSVRPGSTRSGERRHGSPSPACEAAPPGTAAAPRGSCPGRSSTRARRGGPDAGAWRSRSPRRARSRGPARG